MIPLNSAVQRWQPTKPTGPLINRKVRDEHLSHQDYKKSLFEEQQFTHIMARRAQNTSCILWKWRKNH